MVEAALASHLIYLSPANTARYFRLDDATDGEIAVAGVPLSFAQGLAHLHVIYLSQTPLELL